MKIPGLKRFLLAALAVPFLLSAVVIPADAEEPRTALLIANGDYVHFGRLPNPVPEARALGDALKKLGFDVTLVADAGRERMLDALADYETKLRDRRGVAFFHYGGHAVQVGGKNYLIPADADIPDERRVPTRTVDLDEVMAGLQAAGSDTSIVVLDACRDNPLPASSGRSASRGLVVVGLKPKNSVIVYSAEAGTKALDGVFTPALIRHIGRQGLSLSEVLQNVRREVYEKTGGIQTPGEYNQLFGSVYLAGSPGAARAAPAEPAPVPAGPPAVKQAPPPEVKAAHAPAAQTAARLGVPAMVRVEGGAFFMGDTFGGGEADERPVRRVTVSVFHMGRTEVTVREFRRFVEETGYRTNAETFDGSYVWANNLWELKADASWRNPYFLQDDDHPVVVVSWRDAAAYCNWLSWKEGLRPAYVITDNSVTWDFSSDGYRLPTEAEWEYAARGGSGSRGYRYAGSNDPGAVAWYGGNSGGRTRSVGKKAPNELGLYDMSGNVWEWCWDLYELYPDTPQIDPRGALYGTNNIFRGGCWQNAPSYLRPSIRHRNGPFYRCNFIGFRVARSGR